jgi:hypothetical protein
MSRDHFFRRALRMLGKLSEPRTHFAASSLELRAFMRNATAGFDDDDLGSLQRYSSPNR